MGGGRDTYVGADTSLDRHFTFEGGVLVRVGNPVDLESLADELDGVFEAVPECRVARSVQELVLKHEESLRAADTVVAANIIGPPVIACKSSLHSIALRDVELVRRQSLLELGLVALYVFSLPLSKIG